MSGRVFLGDDARGSGPKQHKGQSSGVVYTLCSFIPSFTHFSCPPFTHHGMNICASPTSNSHVKIPSVMMLKAGTLGHEDGAFTNWISVLIRGYQTASYSFSHHMRIQGQGAVCSPEEGSHQKWAMPKPCVSRSLHNCKFLLT